MLFRIPWSALPRALAHTRNTSISASVGGWDSADGGSASGETGAISGTVGGEVTDGLMGSGCVTTGRGALGVVRGSARGRKGRRAGVGGVCAGGLRAGVPGIGATITGALRASDGDPRGRRAMGAAPLHVVRSANTATATTMSGVRDIATTHPSQFREIARGEEIECPFQRGAKFRADTDDLREIRGAVEPPCDKPGPSEPKRDPKRAPLSE